MRPVTLALDPFGRLALEAEAERCALTPAEFVQHAARHFLSARAEARTAHWIPRFRTDEVGDSRLELELDTDDEAWREIRGEADRQRVSADRLLAHATLCLIADLDSGRVAQRMLEEPLTPTGP